MGPGVSTVNTAPSEEIAGRTVVLHYSDPVGEYNIIRQHAAIVDRSHRHRIVFEGEGAAAALNGLVTNDVAALAHGQGQYAAALSPKGKIIADLRIFRTGPTTFLVDAPVRAGEGWMGVVRKYVNPRVARYTDVSDSLRDVGVFGLEALEVVSGVLGLSREVLHKPERFHCSVAAWRDREITVAATTELAVPGFDLFVPADSANALVDQLVASGASHVGLAAWEIARIENGVPEWGIDMDDNTLAQEAELERMHAISFTKGCYTGQETVARVHFRGHVNRHLRQLRFAGVAVPPPGAQVFGDGDRNLGDVRSSAYSPKQGGVAIAMLRHEAVVGSAVSVRWDDMECQAGVYELPLESA